MEPTSPTEGEDAKAIVTDLIARKEHAHAIEFLRGQFKGRSPGPRLRLELADVLVLAGKGEEAVPILIEVTDELLARGSVATAIAALKKVEQIEPEATRLESRVAPLLGDRAPAPSAEPLARADRDDDDTAPVILPPDMPVPARAASESAAGGGEVGGRIRTVFRQFLATLPAGVAERAEAAAPPEEPPATAAPAVEPPPAGASPPAMSAEDFQSELLHFVQDLAERRPAAATPFAAPPPASPGARTAQASAPEAALPGRATLRRSPLFRDLSPADLTALLRGLRLHHFEAGDIILTEGERGDSVYIVAKGTVRVSVRNPEGRNFAVGEVEEGEFFGEIGSLSGRPRSATVTATRRCELLEIDKASLDRLAREHPCAREVLEDLYMRRASSPEAAAVRAVPLAASDTQRRAIEVLEAHFGESRWDPRMRLRLAAVLLRAGKYEDAVPILVSLADDLARQGFPEKAIAVLKKIERIQRRHVEELRLAPRTKEAAPVRAAGGGEPRAGSPAPRAAKEKTEAYFQDWLLDVVRKAVRLAPSPSPSSILVDPAALRAYAPGLLASPLFAGFGEDELLAVIRELRLVSFEAGDIVVTEGEPGESVFILATGAVKVFVGDRAGRSVPLATLTEGCFFGEISTLSGGPRTATVTAAARCEMLELDRAALDALDASHPRVRDVLAAAYFQRTTDRRAAAIRTAPS